MKGYISCSDEDATFFYYKEASSTVYKSVYYC